METLWWWLSVMKTFENIKKVTIYSVRHTHSFVFFKLLTADKESGSIYDVSFFFGKKCDFQTTEKGEIKFRITGMSVKTMLEDKFKDRGINISVETLR